MEGKVFKFGNDVDTDQIIASQYLLVPTVEEMVPYTFESLDKEFASNFKSGDVVVGGSNFGCGSSREQAPMVLKALGAKAIVAKSFARIFFRNCVNIGLPAIISEELSDSADSGNPIDIDFDKGEIIYSNDIFSFSPYSGNVAKILEAGGLINYLNSSPGKDSDQSDEGNTEARPMTITEKLLASKSGRKFVQPGEIVTVAVDRLMTNDATTHVSVDIFNTQVKNASVAKPESVVAILDHNVPADSEKTAHVQNIMRRFCREEGITVHDGEGVCHEIMVQYYARPGDIIIGADSHTPASGALGAFAAGVGSTDFVGVLLTGEIWLRVPESIKIDLEGAFAQGTDARDLMLKIIGDLKADGALYKTIEFSGEGLKSISFDQRMIMCALAVEAGAKSAIFEADAITAAFLESVGRGGRKSEAVQSDPDAQYAASYSYKLGALEPAVAEPHFVDNFSPIDGLDKRVKIDQGFIGSCSVGRIEALRDASMILNGHKVAPEVKLIITPASRAIMKQALEEGLIEIFIDSGAMVMNPNCSVCWGACQGVIGAGETLISTGTRNFKGRAGSKDSLIYLGSAATVAASAIEGYITNPRKYMH